MSSYKQRVLALSVVLLASCSTADQLVDKIMPYKIDIQQGNVVTQEMISKLKPGMPRAQVRFIMGSPLIHDAFHANRWDYVYRFQKAGRLTEERRITLIFDKELLFKVEGDVAPVVPGEPAAAAEAGKPGAENPVSGQPKTEAEKAAASKPAEEEKGFFGNLLEKIGL